MYTQSPSQRGMCGELNPSPIFPIDIASPALLQQDHNLRLIRRMFFAPSNRFLPCLLFLGTAQLDMGFLPSLPIQVDTLWQQRCCFSCQPHPGSTSCKLSISQGMRAFPLQECQRHSLFLSIVQQFFLREKKMLLNLLFVFVSLFGTLRWLFLTIFFRFIIVSWGGKLLIPVFHHRQLSPNDILICQM